MRIRKHGSVMVMRNDAQALDRMTRSAISRMLQFERPWRAPRHRSALRSTIYENARGILLVR
jgi:hypothetical protein